jgi:hypothetical protein
VSGLKGAGINGVRGDVRLMLDGRERVLRLTFGALAEIETELGVADLAELGARLRRLSARDLQLVVGALLRGAGDDAEIEAARVDLGEASRAVAEAFRGAGA